MIWRECESCGKPFQSKRSTAKYCSGTCRAAKFRLRRLQEQNNPKLQFDGFELRMLDWLKSDFTDCYELISKIYREYGTSAAHLALRACCEILESVGATKNQKSDSVNNESTYVG